MSSSASGSSRMGERAETAQRADFSAARRRRASSSGDFSTSAARRDPSSDSSSDASSMVSSWSSLRSALQTAATPCTASYQSSRSPSRHSTKTRAPSAHSSPRTRGSLSDRCVAPRDARLTRQTSSSSNDEPSSPGKSRSAARNGSAATPPSPSHRLGARTSHWGWDQSLSPQAPRLDTVPDLSTVDRSSARRAGSFSSSSLKQSYSPSFCT
mmetsp:Transcript_28184/g.93304  ORF Transcript_28184/g.93304 Transcript_28184/m.93304 type:complete len:212 (-) Transcript_28184:89-724(-)